jgi:hypothetical protein
LEGLNFKERKTYHQLRCGKWPNLRSYTGSLRANLGADINCPSCGVPQTAEHVLIDCSDLEVAHWRRKFWQYDPQPSEIFSNGRKLLDFLQKIPGHFWA